MRPMWCHKGHTYQSDVSGRGGLGGRPRVFCSCFFFLSKFFWRCARPNGCRLSCHVSNFSSSFFSKEKRSKDFYCLFVFDCVVVPNSSTEVQKKKEKKKDIAKSVWYFGPFYKVLISFLVLILKITVQSGYQQFGVTPYCTSSRFVTYLRSAICVSPFFRQKISFAKVNHPVLRGKCVKADVCAKAVKMYFCVSCNTQLCLSASPCLPICSCVYLPSVFLPLRDREGNRHGVNSFLCSKKKFASAISREEALHI